MEKTKEKKEYYFRGSIFEFEREVARNYEATTFAVSKRKAKANIIYRFKKETGRMPTCRITISDKDIHRV